MTETQTVDSDVDSEADDPQAARPQTTRPEADHHEAAARSLPRSRTYTWHDPRHFAERLPTTPGVDLLRAMQAGEIPVPPLAATLDFAEFVVLGEGSVAVSLVPAEHHHNTLGTVHGGVLAALLDTATGCAVHTTLPAGVAYTSLDLSVRFLRPVTSATGVVRAEGTVLSRGSRTATAEARLIDRTGRLLAHATSTCLLFPAA